MKATSVRRVFWSASAALVFLLAAAPVLVAQTAPAGQSGAATIDLNTASQAALERLPGVDAAMARRIIAGRPYASVADLSKAGVPASTIEGIRPLVKVGPVGTAGAATGKAAHKAAAGVGKGANAAAAAIGKGADATEKGVETGVSAAAKGVQKGAAATGSAAGKVNRKITGAPREPPQAGMVWVNTATKVYHKAGDPSYGTTTKGKWLTEEEAVKQGYRAAKSHAAKER